VDRHHDASLCDSFTGAQLADQIGKPEISQRPISASCTGSQTIRLATLTSKLCSVTFDIVAGLLLKNASVAWVHYGSTPNRQTMFPGAAALEMHIGPSAIVQRWESCSPLAEWIAADSRHSKPAAMALVMVPLASSSFNAQT
jgi:hypothetical protein